MRIKTLLADKNGAYIYSTKMPDGKPSGLFWHSTGADNPWVRRYAGDSATKDELIGANPNNNGFGQATGKDGKNLKGESVPCPNAVMGLGADGKMLTVKILPDDYCPWCSGSGDSVVAKKNGFPGNNANFLGFYQLEICEDQTCSGAVYGQKNPYTPKQYADLVYAEMVAFSIDFFKAHFGGDPEKVTPKTLTSHSEAAKMGIASGHADPWHWLGKYGYSGDTLRAAVKAGLQKSGGKPAINDALEILKQLAKMENSAPPGSTMDDALDILKTLAGSGQSTPDSDVLKVGVLVEIIGAYASSATATAAPNRIAVGTKKKVIKIHSGANYPYQVGDDKATTGFAKITSLRKV